MTPRSTAHPTADLTERREDRRALNRGRMPTAVNVAQVPEFDEIIDVRSEGEYAEDHIPGAINSPWQDVTDAQGYLRSMPEQKQRWVDVEHSKEVLVYCGSGVTACVNLLSLELAGIRTGKLYAGGWSDWCSYLS